MGLKQSVYGREGIHHHGCTMLLWQWFYEEGGGSEVDRRREVSEKEFQFPLDIFFSFWGSLFLAAIFQWLL